MPTGSSETPWKIGIEGLRVWGLGLGFQVCGLRVWDLGSKV